MFWRTVFGCLLAAAIITANGCVTMHPSACGVGAMGGGCGIDSCVSCPPTGQCGGRVLGRLNAALTCGSGCGEVYWGEWINHPPSYCDPCDYDGNWTGAGSCGVRHWRPFQGLRNLWGYRFGAVSYEPGCSTGCSSCVPSDMGYEPIEYMPADINGDDMLEAPPLPKPAPDRMNGDSNGQQARRPVRTGRVSHATYQPR